MSEQKLPVTIFVFVDRREEREREGAFRQKGLPRSEVKWREVEKVEEERTGRKRFPPIL